MHSWLGFCLYLAGTVYCYDLDTSKPPAPDTSSNLEFLLLAMEAIGKHHATMRLFRRQLQLEVKPARGVTYSNTGVSHISGNPSTYSISTCSSDTPMSTSDDSEAESRFPRLPTDEERVSVEHGLLPQPPLSGIILHDGRRCSVDMPSTNNSSSSIEHVDNYWPLSNPGNYFRDRTV